MGAYLLIGLFIGIVMVGVYWGLPVVKTGPKSFSRILLILVMAPFLWPIQIAFYVTRYLSNASGANAAFGPSSDQVSPNRGTDEATSMCFELIRMLKEHGALPTDVMPPSAATNSKRMGAITGVIDYVSALYGGKRHLVMERVFTVLFGSGCDAAVDILSEADKDQEFMQAMKDIKDKMRNAKTADEMFGAIASMV